MKAPAAPAFTAQGNLPMTTHHAVVFIAHESAQVLQFDAEHVAAQKIKAHSHHTKQHGSDVRSEHEFFAHVCDALEGIAEILVVGSSTGLADFQRYVRKHQAALVPQIVDYQTVDHPTEKQLVALARQFFVKHDGSGGATQPAAS
jgi:UDP-N-acetylglucosamine:LPS N-acetylglucosamine transferase